MGCEAERLSLPPVFLSSHTAHSMPLHASDQTPAAYPSCCNRRNFARSALAAVYCALPTRSGWRNRSSMAEPRVLTRCKPNTQETCQKTQFEAHVSSIAHRQAASLGGPGAGPQLHGDHAVYGCRVQTFVRRHDGHLNCQAPGKWVGPEAWH